MNGHISVYDFLHSVSDTRNVCSLNGTTDIQLAIITTTDGSTDNQLPMWEKVLDSLCQHEEQCPGISAHTTGMVQTKEANVLIIVEAVVHTLCLIIDMGTNGTVGHLEGCRLKNIEECTAKRHRNGFANILTTDANHPAILFVALLFC